MSAATAALAGRAAAEQQMDSTCRINAKGDGGNVTNPDSGEVTTPAGTLIYEGKCRFRSESGQPSDAETGGAEVVTYDCVVSIPFAALGVEAGHRVTMLTSPDPDVVGMVVEVRKPHRHENGTARRLFCEEVS